MPLTLASDAITFTDSTSLSSGIIGTAQLSAGSVTTTAIASGAVTTEKIAIGAVITDDLANGAVTASKMSGNQTGSAPVFGARAWFTFDCTRDSSGATNQNNTNRFIYGSGNINAITRLSSDRYRIVFQTAMPTINYTPIVNGNIGTLTQNDSYVHDWVNRALSSFEMGMSYNGATYNGSTYVTGVVYA